MVLKTNCTAQNDLLQTRKMLHNLEKSPSAVCKDNFLKLAYKLIWLGLKSRNKRPDISKESSGIKDESS